MKRINFLLFPAAVQCWNTEPPLTQIQLPFRRARQHSHSDLGMCVFVCVRGVKRRRAVATATPTLEIYGSISTFLPGGEIRIDYKSPSNSHTSTRHTIFTHFTHL